MVTLQDSGEYLSYSHVRKSPKTKRRTSKMIKETSPVLAKDCEQHLFLSAKTEWHTIQGILSRIFRLGLE